MSVYSKAYNLEMKEKDAMMHTWIGTYGISALLFAIEHCLNGKKAKTKYIDAPLMQKVENQNKPLSEEDLQKQRELFVAKLEVMKSNFELNKGNNK